MCILECSWQSWPVIRKGKGSHFCCQMNDQFIGDHDDGGIGDLTKHLGQQPPVKSRGTFFSDHKLQSLHKGAVTAALLSKPRPDDLCREQEEKKTEMSRLNFQKAGGQAVPSSTSPCQVDVEESKALRAAHRVGRQCRRHRFWRRRRLPSAPESPGSGMNRGGLEPRAADAPGVVASAPHRSQNE